MSDPKSDLNNMNKTAKDAAATARQGAEQAASEARQHARRAASDVSETAELTYEQLKEHADKLKADLASLTRSAREAGYETAQEAMNSARRMAEEGYEYAGDQVYEARLRAEEYTRERPMAALGIAAAAGFVLAHILSRK
jgi:ElaB/YqjD/DUF883 family membrane-anchored ribosome-binding protein